MKEETVKAMAESICDLFKVESDDSEVFFEVYDIIRDQLYKDEGIELSVA